LENLVSHYSGELPGVESNLEKASEVISDEITLESPQQQAPNLQMASTTCLDIPVPEQTVPEQSVPEQHVPELVPDHIESLSSIKKVSEPDFMITSEDSDVEVEQSNSSSIVVVISVPDQPSETNIQTAISTNDQPSSSNQALQVCAPARSTNVPSPPTLFLDSTI
jgi:hypothetical protein